MSLHKQVHVIGHDLQRHDPPPVLGGLGPVLSFQLQGLAGIHNTVSKGRARQWDGVRARRQNAMLKCDTVGFSTGQMHRVNPGERGPGLHQPHTTLGAEIRQPVGEL